MDRPRLLILRRLFSFFVVGRGTISFGVVQIPFAYVRTVKHHEEVHGQARQS